MNPSDELKPADGEQSPSGFAETTGSALLCPHCKAGLLWNEDRGAHCDGCDDFVEYERPTHPGVWSRLPRTQLVMVTIQPWGMCAMWPRRNSWQVEKFPPHLRGGWYEPNGALSESAPSTSDAGERDSMKPENENTPEVVAGDGSSPSSCSAITLQMETQCDQCKSGVGAGYCEQCGFTQNADLVKWVDDIVSPNYGNLPAYNPGSLPGYNPGGGGDIPAYHR